MSVADLLAALESRLELTPPQVEHAAGFLLTESGDIEGRASLLRALTKKGETAGEIASFVLAFLQHALRPPLNLYALDRPAIDVCGTGGDKLDLFNVSTTGMFILAAAGAAVVKHGNRGITSKSGGADVLEALGVSIDLPPEQFAECVKRHGAGFMLAPQYHPAFKAIAPVRKALAAEGTRTIFNIIGPLLNPLQPPFQLTGVFDAALPETYARILQKLGRQRAWAVHGTTADGRGMDEISTLGPTTIAIADGHALRTETVTVPAAPTTLEDLQGGDAAFNAAVLFGILSGDIRGPKRELVVANAAGALQVAGLAHDWSGGLGLAAEMIDSGKALGVLRDLQAFR